PGNTLPSNMMSESTIPSISLIKLSVQYSGEKLNKLKSNYKEWCKEIAIALSLNGLYEYIVNNIIEPSSNEPHALVNYKANLRLTYAFIASSVAPSEWLGTSPPGPTSTTGSFHPMHKGHPPPETADKICTLIERAFAMGDIKPDLLCCIALLNSLSKHFPHAHSIISRDIMASTDASPYTSMKIHQFLENEQSLLENNVCNNFRPSVALTAHIKLTRPPNGLICSNSTCGKSGHTIKYCIKPGEGMAGKTLTELIATWRAASDQRKKPSPATLKIPVTMKDINGCAFTVMVDHNPSSPATSPPDFVGIACDPAPTSTINEIEYEGWLVVKEQPRTTIDWTKHTAPVDNSTFTVTPLNQTK
ncbi:hypothetical protein L208DRAFT_1218032, partial [Tricholoma matsutake]